MLDLLRKIPSHWTRIYILVMGPLSLAQHFFFNTMNGALLTSLGLYFWMAWFGETKPFTFAQLLIWFSELTSESKTGLATTLVTVIGFLVAFRTATLGWKDQTRMSLRIAVADELELFFDEVAKLTLNIQLYAESVVEEVSQLRHSGLNPETSSTVAMLIEEGPKFRQNRARLSALSIDVHRISSKHYAMLSPLGGVIEALNDSVNALDQITEEMWVHLPIATNQPTSSHAQLFVDRIDLDKWQSLVTCCDKNYDLINGLVSGIRALLFAPLMQLTPSSVSIVMRNSSKFEEALSTIRRR